MIQKTIQAISKMNIESIGLNHNLSNRLKKIFEELKQGGDTELIPYSGKCVSKKCDNKNSLGYTFVGNKTNCSLNLIIEDSNNIFECKDFEIKDKTIKPYWNFSLDKNEIIINPEIF